jgi:hypothetical protein
MEGLELIRLFSDSKEKFVELRLLKKEQKDADLIKLMALKEWFEGERKSVEHLLTNNGLKFVDRMMLEKLGKDYQAAIQNINKLIK